MYKVIARLFKNNQLVGYTLDDGTSQRDITRNIVWELAKSHQIMNVKATGTIEDMTLSGINGFELKSLPQRIFGEPVKKEEDFKPTVYDLSAQITREFLNEEYKYAGGIRLERSKAHLSKEVADGTINNYNRCRLSNSVEVIAILKDSFSLKPNFNLSEEVEKRVEKNVSIEEQLKKSSCKVVGYRIKNIGTEPIEIIRMTVKVELEKGILLKANDEINISMAELMVLGSRIEFSNVFYNAKVRMDLTNLSMDELTPAYDYLDNAIYVSNEYAENAEFYHNFRCTDIRKYESPDVIKKYFAKCEGAKPGPHYKVDKEAKRDLINFLEKEGLFKGFKR